MQAETGKSEDTPIQNSVVTDSTMISNQSEFIFRDDLNFVNVGERCNISGSIQFKKLVKSVFSDQKDTKAGTLALNSHSDLFLLYRWHKRLVL